MRAEWRVWDEDIDPIMAQQLVLAWLRRKRIEARIMAVEIGRVLFPEKPKTMATDAQLRAWGIGVPSGNNTS